jgi:antirestriction protein ArdC
VEECGWKRRKIARPAAFLHIIVTSRLLQILKEDSRAIFHATSQASKATDFILAFQQSREADIPTAEAAE